MPKIVQLKPKVIGIVGSRRRNSANDLGILSMKLSEIIQPSGTLVSGGYMTGADAMAEIIARNRGLTLTIHYADWNGPAGKAAGFVRNSKIAADCDVLIALVADDRMGGTEDTVRKVLKLGKEVILA